MKTPDTLGWLSLALSVLLVFPVAYLVYLGYGPLFVRGAAFGRGILESVGLTFLCASASSAAIVLLFTPVSYHLSRRGNSVTEGLLDLPASVPHPLVGIALVFIDSPATPVGRFLFSHGLDFYYSYLGVVLALFIVSAPIYIRAMTGYFSSLPQSAERYAAGLGASRLRIFRLVVLPQAGKGILSAGLTSVSRAISEFGSIVILAPYVTGWVFSGVSPASVYVYNEYLSYFDASVSSAATLILFSVGLLVVTRLVSARIVRNAGYTR